MSDLIFRENVLKNFENMCEDCFAYTREKKEEVICRRCFIQTVKDIIKESPFAEPEERKKGKWQRRKGSDCWECSQCHAVLENDDLEMHNFYFCYHCGANMMNKSGHMDIEEVHYE